MFGVGRRIWWVMPNRKRTIPLSKLIDSKAERVSFLASVTIFTFLDKEIFNEKYRPKHKKVVKYNRSRDNILANLCLKQEEKKKRRSPNP